MEALKPLNRHQIKTQIIKKNLSEKKMNNQIKENSLICNFNSISDEIKKSSITLKDKEKKEDFGNNLSSLCKSITKKIGSSNNSEKSESIIKQNKKITKYKDVSLLYSHGYRLNLSKSYLTSTPLSKCTHGSVLNENSKKKLLDGFQSKLLPNRNSETKKIIEKPPAINEFYTTSSTLIEPSKEMLNFIEKFCNSSEKIFLDEEKIEKAACDEKNEFDLNSISSTKTKLSPIISLMSYENPIEKIKSSKKIDFKHKSSISDMDNPNLSKTSHDCDNNLKNSNLLNSKKKILIVKKRTEKTKFNKSNKNDFDFFQNILEKTSKNVEIVNSKKKIKKIVCKKESDSVGIPLAENNFQTILFNLTNSNKLL